MTWLPATSSTLVSNPPANTLERKTVTMSHILYTKLKNALTKANDTFDIIGSNTKGRDGKTIGCSVYVTDPATGHRVHIDTAYGHRWTHRMALLQPLPTKGTETTVRTVMIPLQLKALVEATVTMLDKMADPDNAVIEDVTDTAPVEAEDAV